VGGGGGGVDSGLGRVKYGIDKGAGRETRKI
jgi:hypothetical protein